jgi:hypothetical protein
MGGNLTCCTQREKLDKSQTDISIKVSIEELTIITPIGHEGNGIY